MNPNQDNQNDGVNPAPAPEVATPAVEPTPTIASGAPITGQAPFASADPLAQPQPGADPATTPNAAQPIVGAPAPAPGGKGPKLSKKMLIIIAAVGGVVLLAAIAAAVYISMTSVSKEDYRAAALQYNEVSRASSDLTYSVSSLSYATDADEDAEFNEAMTEVEEALTTLRAEDDELSKLKAVRFGEGADYYKEFETKLDAYTAYADELIASVKNLRPALKICASISDADDNAGRVAALKECASALGSVESIPNEEFKNFVDGIKPLYEEYATIFEQLNGITDPYGDQYDQYRALRDQVYEVQDKISDVSSTFSDALDKRDEEMSVKEVANKLGDFLVDAQN